MKKSFIHQTILSLGFAIGLAAAPTSAIASPLTDSCKLKQSLMSGGGKSGAISVYNMAHAWGKKSRDKIIPQLMAPFSKFSYTSGGVFLIADFDDMLKEYLVVMEAPESSSGSVFFMLTFGKGNGSLKFTNIEFSTKYRKMVGFGFAQKPQRQNCS